MSDSIRNHAVACLFLALLCGLIVASSARAEDPDRDRHQEAIRQMYSLDWSNASQAEPTSQSLGATNATEAQGSLEGPSLTAGLLGTPGQSFYFGQIYGYKDGRLVGCNIEIVTGSPSPMRLISYGLVMTCSDPSIHGQGLSNLAEVVPTPLRPLALGSFFDITGDNQPHYNIYNYYRESDVQFEQIYAYFSVTIDGIDNVDGWLTHPTGGPGSNSIRCTDALRRTLSCEIITDPFPFVPDGTYRCDSGDVCDAVRAAQQTVAATVGTAVATAQAQYAAAQAMVTDLVAYFAEDPEPGLIDFGLTDTDQSGLPSGVLGPDSSSDPVASIASRTLVPAICSAFSGRKILDQGGFLEYRFNGGMRCKVPVHMRVSTCLKRNRTGATLACGPEYGSFDPPDGPLSEEGRSGTSYFAADTASQRRLYVRNDVSATLTAPNGSHWIAPPDGCAIRVSDPRRVDCAFRSTKYRPGPMKLTGNP